MDSDIISSKKNLLQMGLSRRQKTALRKAPSPDHIRTRREGDKDLAYLEGWYVIAEANRIFGTEHWDRITLTANCVWQGRKDGNASCTYTARVRICIRAGVYTLVREGSGCGHAHSPNAGEAHGTALKAAETDATKRALATLGAPFGLSLYEQDQKQAGPANVQEQLGASDAARSLSRPIIGGAKITLCTAKEQLQPALWIARGAVGESIGVYTDPILCCSSLRRAIEHASTTIELEAIFKANRRLLSRLRAERPDLRSDTEQHYSEILAGLFRARLKRLSEVREKSPASTHQEAERSNIPYTGEIGVITPHARAMPD